MKIIDWLKSIWKVVLSFLNNWSEAWAFVPAFFIIVFFSPIIHFFSKTASVPDPGYIGKFLIALVIMLLTHGCVWLGIKFNYPTLFKYSDDGFSNDWQALNPWQKIRIYFFVPAFFLFLLVVLVIAL